MKLMISLTGEPEHLPFLPEIASLGAGIELGSYGLVGVRSPQDWENRVAMHLMLRAKFHGPVALHGPFLGMEYSHMDHLIREVVRRRLDMTFKVAQKLNARRVILHSGYTTDIELFHLQEAWLEGCVAFWQQEIQRWAQVGIEIVIENDTEPDPDHLVQLADAVDNLFFRLCLDTGHQHVFSKLGALEWVRRMSQRLTHIHLHDNDGAGDRHWPIGRGSIDFEPIYAAVQQQAPQATFSLEVQEAMDVKMHDLRKLAARFS